MDVYEEACAQYLDGMYRIAFIALGDDIMAAQTVEAVYKSVVHARHTRGDIGKIRLWLIAELYRRCKAQSPATVSSLPQALRFLSYDERLLLALRASFDLTEAETASILTAHP